MNRAVAFYRSTVGKKQLMAVTGVLLVGFVVIHMLGHLQMFAGPEVYNSYAASLKGLGPILWVARIGLLGLTLVHVVAAIQVSLRNKAARPEPYAVTRMQSTSYAAVTMRIGGPLLLLFVGYHLAHHTLLITGPGKSPTDIYRNMVLGFQVPWITAIYALSMVVLGLHLYHGVWSMLQTLGVDYPAIETWRRLIAPAFAILVVAGYLSVPIGVLLGIIK